MVRRICRIAAAVLLVVVGLAVYRRVSLLGGSGMTLPPPEDRALFIDFTLPDVQGNLVRLLDLRGRPVLINLWATWCYPCRVEMPSMNALYKDFQAKGLAILAIAIDAGGKPAVAPFLQAYRLTFSVLLDPQNMLGTQLQVPGIPASYLLDTRGRLVDYKFGRHDWDTPAIRHLVDQLLAEDGGGTAP